MPVLRHLQSSERKCKINAKTIDNLLSMHYYIYVRKNEQELKLK